MRWTAGVSLAAPCLALLMVGLGPSCGSPPRVPDHAPRAVTELDRWDVQTDGRRIGTLVLLRIEDAVASEPFFQVQNEHGQWLGYIDANGRVYERVPFSMTEVFRGIHPMEDALAMLYDERGAIEIVPLLASTAAEADATARQRGEPLPATAFRPPYHRRP